MGVLRGDLSKPLLGQDGRAAQQDNADYGPCLEKGYSNGREEEWTAAETGGKTSFWQTTVNFVNSFLGLGLIALPSSLQSAGWMSLLLLLTFAIICFYTGLWMVRCLEAPEGARLQTYQDVGAAAFGARVRAITTAFLCIDITGYLVGSTIALGDNLARIFPGAGLDADLLGLHLQLRPQEALVLVALVVILPTVWLRDMKSLSFVSVGGVATALVVLAAVAWAGALGGVGFHHSPPLLRLGNLPMVSGVYAYCYAEQVVIPTVYRGMRTPSQLPKVLVVSGSIVSVIYGAMAVTGATMFGEDTESQITLNIPRSMPAASVALWTTVLTPLAKFGLALAPVVQPIEARLPFPRESRAHLAVGTGIRTALVLAVVAVAFAVPFFQYILALIGSLVSMTMAVTFPAAFYLKLFRSSLSRAQIAGALFCIVWGIFFAVVGTALSFKALLEMMNQS